MSALRKLKFDDHVPLQLLFGGPGTKDGVAALERETGVALHLRGNEVSLECQDDAAATLVERLLRQMYGLARSGTPVQPRDLARGLEILRRDPAADLRGVFEDVVLTTRSGKKPIVPRTLSQKYYVDCLRRHDLIFGVGPAGTGKTYLAVASAVRMLLDKRVRRIILTRPAIEAGENLGFLPGTLEEKVSPYMRPIYDALDEMLDGPRVMRMMEHGTIEVAPIAYMRGRTLSETFVILDEAQNTTVEQMKMFLTRIGTGTRAVVTGDPSQLDLPNGKRSGLAHALRILHGIDGIAFCKFEARDVMRHRLVQRIIGAYDHDEQERASRKRASRARAQRDANGGSGANGGNGGSRDSDSGPVR